MRAINTSKSCHYGDITHGIATYFSNGIRLRNALALIWMASQDKTIFPKLEDREQNKRDIVNQMAAIQTTYGRQKCKGRYTGTYAWGNPPCSPGQMSKMINTFSHRHPDIRLVHLNEQALITSLISDVVQEKFKKLKPQDQAHYIQGTLKQEEYVGTIWPDIKTEVRTRATKILGSVSKDFDHLCDDQKNYAQNSLILRPADEAKKLLGTAVNLAEEESNFSDLLLKLKNNQLDFHLENYERKTILDILIEKKYYQKIALLLADTQLRRKFSTGDFEAIRSILIRLAKKSDISTLKKYFEHFGPYVSFIFPNDKAHCYTGLTKMTSTLEGQTFTTINYAVLKVLVKNGLGIDQQMQNSIAKEFLKEKNSILRLQMLECYPDVYQSVEGGEKIAQEMLLEFLTQQQYKKDNLERAFSLCGCVPKALKNCHKWEKLKKKNISMEQKGRKSFNGNI